MGVVLMYGAGDGGAAGWPVQSAELGSDGWVFLERLPATPADPVPWDDAERDADRVVEALGDGAHLVAHSGGAVAALLALSRAPERVRSLTLFEPACLGVAIDRPAVAAMVTAMSAVFDRAGDDALSDGEFAHLFLVSMGTPGADPADPETAAFGGRTRLMAPPWRTPLSLAAVAEVPTLVVTGGWSAAFDEVADVLVAAGAQHVVVPGTGHGPQYHPDGHAAMTRFQAAASG